MRSKGKVDRINPAMHTYVTQLCRSIINVGIVNTKQKDLGVVE